MSDLIERQAAIDAIRASTSKYTGFMEMEMYTDDDAVEAIEALPSVEAIPVEWLKELQTKYLEAECFMSVCVVNEILNLWRKENG